MKDFNSSKIRKSHYDELIKYMPHNDKILWAKTRIKEFINECQQDNINEITISFSGGKDSTVLLDLVLKTHQELKSKINLVIVYAAEITFPSTFKFINEVANKYQQKYQYLKNVQIIKPKLPWNEILEQKGYPIFSKQVSTLINRVKRARTKNNLTQWFFGINQDKTSTARYKLSKNRLFLLDDNMLNNWPKLNNQKMKEYFKKYNDHYFFSEKCCDNVKGNLKHDNRPSFIGTMAIESQMRKKSWIEYGCNIYNKRKKKSRPISIWTSKDIWTYIKNNHLDVNPAYGYNPKNTYEKQNFRFNRLGCTSCPYGSSIEQRIIELNKKRKETNTTNKYLLKNRFEILKEEWPNLYLSQIIWNGMYKILIDMDIKIENDDLYMELYDKRHKQIEKWYNKKNLKNNILKIMTQIENHQNYKKRNDKYSWSYNKNEFQQAIDYLCSWEKDKINMSEIKQIRKKTREEWIKNHSK